MHRIKWAIQNILLVVVALAANCLFALPALGVAVNWRVIPDDPNFPTEDTLLAGVVFGDTYFSPAHTPPANPATTDCSVYVNDVMTYLSGAGGGTIYFPPGHYKFTNQLVMKGCVILRGRWAQPGEGLPVTDQTIFDVYYGKDVNPIEGATDTNAFIYSAYATPDAGVRDLVFWYPNQNPTNWTVYPFTIANMANMKTIENVTLVNSYAGIDHAKACFTANRHIYGTTLTAGLHLDWAAAMPRFDDINLSPDYWAWSGLSNAPSGTALSTLKSMMLFNTNTYGLNIQEMDGSFYKEINVSGYCYGLLFNFGARNDANWSEFYNCTITNCTEAVRIESAKGLQFFGCMFAGTTNGYGVHHVNKTAGNFYDVDFSQCNISGGLDAILGDATVANQYSLGLQGCTLGGTVSVGNKAVLRVVGSTFTTGGRNIILGDGVQQALINGNRGNSGAPATVQNNSGSGTVLINTNTVAAFTLPYFPTNYMETRKPAQTNLFNVTKSPFNANPNGTTDATLAISNALVAAAANGGGIVFFPAGKYLVSSALTVSDGVELRGVFGARHENPGSAGTGETGFTGSQLNIKANQGSSNEPACFTLLGGAGIRGMNMDYPVQNSATGSQTPYPYMIECRGTNNYVIDCCCGALYQGVDLNGAKNALMEYNFFGGLVNTYMARGGATDCRIQNCMVKPANWWLQNAPPQTDGADIILAKTLNTIIAGDCTNLTVQMIFNHVGHTLFTGRGGSGQALMLGGEKLQRAFVMESGTNNFNFIGCDATPNLQGDGTGLCAWWLQTNFIGTVRSVSAHVAASACDYIARVDSPNGHLIFDDYFQDQGSATPKIRSAGQVVINNAHLTEFFTLDVPAGGRFDCFNSILLQMPDAPQAGILNYSTGNNIIPKSFIASIDHSGDTSQLPCYPFGVTMHTNNLQADWANLKDATRDPTVRGVMGLVLSSGSNFVCHVTDPRFINAAKQTIVVYYLSGDTTASGTLVVKYRSTGGTMKTAGTIVLPDTGAGVDHSSSMNVSDAQFLGGTNQDIVLTATGTSPVVCDVIVTANTAYLGLPPQLPTAQFVGVPTSGARPLWVTFTNQSTGSITNMVWTFGDGQNTNATGGAVFGHVYTNIGSYTVRLVASGLAGSSTNTRTGYITVNEPQPPTLAGVSLSGATNVLFTGSGGPTNGTYYYWVLCSMNLTLPLASWSVISTNLFNPDGTFSNALPVIPGIPTMFYRLQLP